MRIGLLAVALVATWTAAAQSRIETFTVKSSILGTEKPCTVYLPDGYDQTQTTYPVLYLLHGASGCHTDWIKRGIAKQIADEAIGEGMASKMIIVMPDASGSGERKVGPHMGYFNVTGWNYEDFFFKEFLPSVEKHYRIRGDKKHRAISGLSMGGGGTAVYALHHPELFGSACPISGLLDTLRLPRDYYAEFSQSVADNSAVRLMRDLDEQGIAAQRTVRWWVDCGDDDFLYENNIHLYEQMRRHQIPVQYRMRDGGHTWRYWQIALTDILSYISIGFGE